MGKQVMKFFQCHTIRPLSCRGFTLIELLMVVTIIGILAAIAIPGYLGVQEKTRKGAIIRSASGAESEIQAWLASANKGLVAGTGFLGRLFEVDSDGNGVIVSGVDMNNSALGSVLSVADGLCSQYVFAKQTAQNEMSPWAATGGFLWQPGAPQPGKITCNHLARDVSVTIVAQDRTGATIHQKVLYAD